MEQVYDELMILSNDIETSFFHKDHMLDDVIYRIFNYRLASYTEFMKPSGIECRGIMFEVDTDGNYIDIKSRPMAKFWNQHELKMINIDKLLDLAKKAKLNGDLSENVYNTVYEEYLQRISD